jgi:hypothetical protein
MMADFHKRNFFARGLFYSQLWYGNRNAENYNRRVQDVLVMLSDEKSMFLRMHIYQTFMVNVFVDQSTINPDTFARFAQLVSHEPSNGLRATQHKTMELFLRRPWSARFHTQNVKQTFKDSLRRELQRYDNAVGRAKIEHRNVLDYILPIIELLDRTVPDATPTKPVAGKLKPRVPKPRRG